MPGSGEVAEETTSWSSVVLLLGGGQSWGGAGGVTALQSSAWGIYTPCRPPQVCHRFSSPHSWIRGGQRESMEQKRAVGWGFGGAEWLIVG